MEAKHSAKASKHITEARSAAQREKLDDQAEESRFHSNETVTAKKTSSKKEQQDLLARRRAATTIECAIADYLADYEGGNSSPQTLQSGKRLKATPLIV